MKSTKPDKKAKGAQRRTMGGKKGAPAEAAPPKEEEEEEEEEVGEEDLEFFKGNTQFANFLGGVDPKNLTDLLGNKTTRRASKKAERERQKKDNTEAEWERKPRTASWDEAPEIPRLPVKDAHGNLIVAKEYRKLGADESDEDGSEAEAEVKEEGVEDGDEGDDMDHDETDGASIKDEDEEDEEEDDEDDEEEEEEMEVEQAAKKEKKGKEMVSELQKFHSRQQQNEHTKMHIAHLCTKIIEDPEENMLKELTEMCFQDDAIAQKLAVLSLLEVFKDIIPGYRVRLPTAEEKQMKVSKEVKKVREFEARLLSSYQKYLQKLEKIMKYKPAQGDEAPHVKVDVHYRILAVKSVPHFNFTWNIISLLVPYLASNNAELRTQCIKAIHTVFENDKQGGTTRQTVKLIGQFVKSKGFRSRPETIEVLLHIKFTDMLKEGDVTLDPAKTHLSKKDKKKLTKKQYRALQEFKVMKEVEAEMKEAEAAQSKEERKTIQTDILRSVFITYFRVLKRTTNSPLLPSVLRGLVRYTRFINIDFIQDIITALRELIGQDNSPLSVPTQLQCAITALQMLQQNSLMYNALNIDLKELYARLYELLPFIPTHSIKSPELVKSLLHCLSLMSKDKKQVSVNRMAGFAKRLMNIAMCLPPNACLAIISIIKEIFNRHPRSQQLLDSEFVGSGTFMAEVSDPEHANPLASTLWEFPMAKDYYHPTVVDYSARVLQAFVEADGGHAKPVQAPGGVSPAAKSEPMALYKAFQFETVGFNPAIPKPRAHPLEKILRKQSKGRRRRAQEFFIRAPKGEPSAFMQSALAQTEGIGAGGLEEFREQARLWTQVYHDLELLPATRKSAKSSAKRQHQLS
ncbi:nucleolar complex associated protein, putative [Acanthamoeba castellanii str. Neff]|uniref:Nucleolar complex associated protein, putative n=1 Tax=Acanthamoeba castellanii (strain ATCC 30010 / Neff) TaxID=1257118 RepID=L8H9T8_ACACF|nr:nucleolar complex associated protein, putative [Acanthamoeba castellanii str. Neff]ELR22289.1 nucleolar complex associated protein, putative [Acanthamoeba castellanii str. Neff]